jgi:hypothetical protein
MPATLSRASYAAIVRSLPKELSLRLTHHDYDDRKLCDDHFTFRVQSNKNGSDSDERTDFHFVAPTGADTQSAGSLPIFTHLTAYQCTRFGPGRRWF